MKLTQYNKLNSREIDAVDKNRKKKQLSSAAKSNMLDGVIVINVVNEIIIISDY